MQTGLRLSELTGLPRQDVALGIASGGVIVAKNGRFENHRTTSLKTPVVRVTAGVNAGARSVEFRSAVRSGLSCGSFCLR